MSFFTMITMPAGALIGAVLGVALAVVRARKARK
ncbi:hypothetical protein SAMN05216552_100585 [Pseudoduganella namucuonensis]|uniref:Uncharacterized protein n=1 Tax=Pseudoduganella namucuonensis TaxID=1035707 RepID=A0A1I7H9K1_9BURK|nr:hypothetical protein SAMN05216552_100585 [Pseudoduganella namucuonensis]